MCSFRNDGNVWMAIRLLEDKSNSGSWINASKSEFAKPPLDSLRIISSDWPTESLADSQIDVLGQGPLEKSRFGVAGAWLRFFTQSPELDPSEKNNGAARAISYQIVRHGVTGSPTSRQRYHLFRSDVSAKNTLKRDTTWTQKLQQVAMGFPPHQFPLTPMLLELPAYLQLLLTQLLARARNILPLRFHYRPI